MGIVGAILVLVVVVIHILIFIIEVFQWTRPIGLMIFNLEEKFANSTKVMAINQGWYNLFLAAGLIYALLSRNFGDSIFFLACVSIAGIVGGITSSKKIVLVQTVPAILAAIFLILRI